MQLEQTEVRQADQEQVSDLVQGFYIHQKSLINIKARVFINVLSRNQLYLSIYNALAIYADDKHS